MQTPLIVGNWKMNGLQAARDEARALAQAVAGLDRDVVLCPPATLVADLARDLSGTRVAVGGQDCHEVASGAHTGDISAEMIRDAGGAYVIVGHSERRANHGETDATVCGKARAGLRAGLVTILCVGETEAYRRKGQHLAVVEAQLDGSVPREATPDRLVIAYEPVWAIGTGLNAGRPEIEEMPDNAADILHSRDVGGVLVGGASLKAADFAKIATA